MYISLLDLPCLPNNWWCRGINTAYSLASDLCSRDRTYTVSRAPLWAEPTCPPNPLGGFCLISHPCVGFPLFFCVHTISLSPYCFPPLIHRNPHLRGTEHVSYDQRCLVLAVGQATITTQSSLLLHAWGWLFLLWHGWTITSLLFSE